MTRFARAHGSKASNERTPEEATPWSLMKRQLVEDKLKKEPYTHDNVVSSRFMKDAVGKRSFSNPDTNSWEVFDSDVKECTLLEKDSIKNKPKKGLPSDLKKIGKQKKDKLVNVSCSNVEKQKFFVKGNQFSVSVKNNEVSTIGVKKTDINLNNRDSFKIRVKNCNSSSSSSDYKTPVKNFVSETLDEFKNNQNIVEKNRNNFKKVKSFKPPPGNAIEITENDEFHKHDNKTKSKVFLTNTNSDIDKYNSQKRYKNIKTNHSGFPYGKAVNNWQNSSINVGGKIVEIAEFHGFAVKKEDAQRLHKLRKDLLLKGVPRKEVEVALKAERRRAEKALAREKKAVCFKCRKSGHNMSECPDGDDPSGVCFKCGSTEHSGRDCRVVQNDSFKYAHCFICQEQGHIARQCPDNPRGLYPKGGACKVCGDVTHLKKDCPELINDKEISTLTVGTVKNNSIEVLDEDLNESKQKRHSSKKTKLVTF